MHSSTINNLMTAAGRTLSATDIEGRAPGLQCKKIMKYHRQSLKREIGKHYSLRKQSAKQTTGTQQKRIKDFVVTGMVSLNQEGAPVYKPEDV